MNLKGVVVLSQLQIVFGLLYTIKWINPEKTALDEKHI